MDLPFKILDNQSEWVPTVVFHNYNYLHILKSYNIKVCLLFVSVK